MRIIPVIPTLTALPFDVKVKLLTIGDALLIDDYGEAWHQLYLIADPECVQYEPWDNLEKWAELEPGEREG